MSIGAMADKKPSNQRNKRTALIFGAVALGWFLVDVVWHLFHPFH